MMTKSTARTQLRAICPACFAQQALVNGRMSQHGYRRPQMWHANVGTCHGTGRAHFGTEAGRKVAEDVAAGLVNNAGRLEALAESVLDGTEEVFGRRRKNGVVVSEIIDNPTAQQRSQYAASLQGEACACREAAKDYDAKVAAWQPAEPVEVKIEEKQATMHFRATWYYKGGHKACAGSAMGARRGYAALTDDPTKVTCDRCKMRKSFVEALAKVAAR